MIERLKSFKTINAFLYGVGIVLFAVHFWYLKEMTIDIPFHDEWGMLCKDCLGNSLHWEWLFRTHNEHRIVTTKLLFWILYHINSWNIQFNILLNFIIYFFLGLSTCYLFEKNFKIPSGIVLVAFSSIVAVENHGWAFQVQFHLFLLFFILGILFLYSNKASYLSPLFILLSTFSFSSAIITTISYTLLCVVLSFIEKENQKKYLLFSTIAITSILLWFINYSRPESNTIPLTMPWEARFWFYFSNMISQGFGFILQYNATPGYILLLVGTGLIIAYIKMVWINKDYYAKNHSILLFLLVAFVGSLALISVARGKNALYQPEFFKPSRYGEIGLFLFPIFWTILHSISQFYFSKHSEKILVLSCIALLYPFKKNFDFKNAYIGHNFERGSIRNCIFKYYDTNDFTVCKPFYSSLKQEYVDRAKELELHFYKSKYKIR